MDQNELINYLSESGVDNDKIDFILNTINGGDTNMGVEDNDDDFEVDIKRKIDATDDFRKKAQLSARLISYKIDKGLY